LGGGQSVHYIVWRRRIDRVMNYSHHYVTCCVLHADSVAVCLVIDVVLMDYLAQCDVGRHYRQAAGTSYIALTDHVLNSTTAKQLERFAALKQSVEN